MSAISTLPPIVLFEQDRTEPDNDCACPDPSVVIWSKSDETSTLFQKTKPVYAKKLKPDFWLLFGAVSPNGPAILDQAAYTRWGEYHSPAPLSRDVDQILAQQNLITPVSDSFKLVQKAESTLTVWLQITDLCNLCCDYCFVHQKGEALSSSLGKHAIEAIFEIASRHSFRKVKIKFAGGEPTLALPLVLDLNKQAQGISRSSGIELESIILSNGVSLSDVQIQQIQMSGLRLVLSLDGLGLNQDIQRHGHSGHGSWQSVVGTLDRLATTGVKPQICITVTARNLAGLPDLVAFLLKRDLAFSFNFYRPSNNSEEKNDLRYTNHDLIEAMRAAFAKIKERISVDFSYTGLLDRVRLSGPHIYPCGAGESYLVISTQGAVSACHMISQPNFPLSESQLFQKLQFSSPWKLDKGGSQEKCEHCLWRYACAGGCPGLTGSPNCQIYQALIPDLLEMEGLRLLKKAGLS